MIRILIAEEFALRMKSISTYRARIVEKLHCKSIGDLKRYTLEHRLFV
jgi:DNA-binding NarL/FixJ family response regulator